MKKGVVIVLNIASGNTDVSVVVLQSIQGRTRESWDSLLNTMRERQAPVRSVSYARNVAQANQFLEGMVSEKEGVSVLLMDEESMVEPNTRPEIDQLRTQYSDSNVGSLIIEHNQHFDPKKDLWGACRAVAPPPTPDTVTDAINALVRTIHYKSPPQAKEIPYGLTMKKPESVQELHEHIAMRYEVHGPDGMDFMSQERHNKSRLDIDPYDIRAIPFTAYLHVGDLQIPVAEHRWITRTRQEPYATWLEEIVGDTNDSVLARLLHETPNAEFPTAEVYDFSELYAKHGFATPGELSRNTVPLEVFDPHTNQPLELRGMRLSRHLIEFVIAHVLEYEAPLAMGMCDAKHTGMYEKYGYYPVHIDPNMVAPEVRVIDDFRLLPPTIPNPSTLVFADFRTTMPADTQRNVEGIRNLLQQGFTQTYYEPMRQVA